MERDGAEAKQTGLKAAAARGAEPEAAWARHRKEILEGERADTCKGQRAKEKETLEFAISNEVNTLPSKGPLFIPGLLCPHAGILERSWAKAGQCWSCREQHLR